jgi:ribosomal protein S18 acetylase RimI-like enzyme
VDRRRDSAGVPVGPLAARDLAAAERVLARAFRDSPLNVAVIGTDPERRLRANLSGAHALLPVALASGVVLGARTAEGLCGVLVATRPFGWPLPPPPLLANLRRVFGQGLSVASRWGEVFDALARVHPPDPHWYLATLGIEPEFQSGGRGSALLASWLEGVSADAVPAWLETDREANLAFYRRAGFEVELEVSVLDTRVWCMRRP